MQTENKYIEQLTENLKTINPYMVLLFGSYAYGTPNQGSDIDLLVVTNDDFIPKDYNEHNQLYLKVSKAIRPVKKQIAVDLIVYTLPMYELFKKQNSSFGNEIVSKGKIIYERNHTTMA
jgi:predicted nucleotidyltransferase